MKDTNVDRCSPKKSEIKSIAGLVGLEPSPPDRVRLHLLASLHTRPSPFQVPTEWLLPFAPDLSIKKPNMNLSPDSRSSFKRSTNPVNLCCKHKHPCRRTLIHSALLLYIVEWYCPRVRDPSLCLPPLSPHPPSQAELPPVTPTRDHHLQDLLRTISSATQQHDRVTVERRRQTWLCNIYAEHGTWKNLTKRRRGTQNSENRHGVRPDAKMGETYWCGLFTARTII